MHDIADAGYGQACYNTLHVQHHHATRPDHCDRKNGAAVAADDVHLGAQRRPARRRPLTPR